MTNAADTEAGDAGGNMIVTLASLRAAIWCECEDRYVQQISKYLSMLGLAEKASRVRAKASFGPSRAEHRAESWSWTPRWAEPSLEQNQVESRVPSPGLKRARARADPSQAEMNLVRSASRSQMSRAQSINPSQYPSRTEFNRSRVEPSQASNKAKLSPSNEPWPKPSPSPIRSEPARHESSPYRYSSGDESRCGVGVTRCDAYPTITLISPRFGGYERCKIRFWKLWTMEFVI